MGPEKDTHSKILPVLGYIQGGTCFFKDTPLFEGLAEDGTLFEGVFSLNWLSNQSVICKVKISIKKKIIRSPEVAYP